MEWFRIVVGVVTAFFSGFVGHVIAHDFCAVAPSLAARLVRAAASRMPEAERSRYLEEWLADLEQCPTTTQKLMWAIGCLRGLHSMRLEALRAYYSSVVVVVHLEPTPISLSIASLKFSERFCNAMVKTSRWLRPNTCVAIAKFYATTASWWRYRTYGKPDITCAIETMRQFVRAQRIPASTTYRNGEVLFHIEERILGKAGHK